MNAEEFIEHTMESVLNQTSILNGNDELHYIVQDGNSSDRTIAKAKSIAAKYTNRHNIIVDIVSERDQGMYDALTKGLKSFSTGDICSYINAGDYYSGYAFEIVSEIFSKQSISFLTGLRCIYNDRNHLISCVLPYTYRKKMVLTGMYGTVLPEIQQESTFWSFSLNKNINYEKLKTIRLAGDFYLWKSFVSQVHLYIVSAYLGGFKIHRDQLSETFKKEYTKELKSLADKPTLSDYSIAYLDKILWYAPARVKKIFSNSIFQYKTANKMYTMS